MSVKRIDTHVHCRDGKQSYKAKIRDVMSLARGVGIVAICDMPNKSPPITNELRVNEFVGLAEQQDCLDGYYLYIGVTPDMDQIRHAVGVAKEHPRVVGMKSGTTKEFGELCIGEQQLQKRLFRTYAEEGFMGVHCYHCEKESMFRMDKWDPERPWTWNEARPAWCETAEVEGVISNAIEEGFQGTLYIPHVSAAETADLIHACRPEAYRKGLQIVCGIVPHHFLKSTEDMRTREGLEYKTNPPVRDPDEVEALRTRAIQGMFDLLETDHAPHSHQEKFGPPYASGYPSLRLYNNMLSSMRSLGVTEEMITDMTYRNAKRIFDKISE